MDRVIILVVVALLACGASFYAGSSRQRVNVQKCEDDMTALRNNYAADTRAAEERAATELAAVNDEAKEKADAYEKRIAKLRAELTGHHTVSVLCPGTSGPAAGGHPPDHPGGPAGSTPDGSGVAAGGGSGGSVTLNVRGIDILVEQGIEVSDQLRTLQEVCQ